MTTDRQIAANRANANKSTGPRTENGKRRSRRNALRHGLTAETLIEVLEDPIAYRALAKAINADFRPATGFERELMARLVSLLWRLRRATAIESGLLAQQAPTSRSCTGSLEVFYRLIDPGTTTRPPGETHGYPENSRIDRTELARAFVKLAEHNGTSFDRLARYESRLWRQLVQIVTLVNAISQGSTVTADNDRRLRMRSVNGLLWPPFTRQWLEK